MRYNPLPLGTDFISIASNLIGNNDRHGRNLGFISSSKGVVLAPFYDNPSALGVESHSFLSADLQPRGTIFTKHSDKPTMKDYLLEWNRLGYVNVINQFRKAIATAPFMKHLECKFLSEKRQNALKRLIGKRTEEVFNG